jgi:hypothetical protein
VTEAPPHREPRQEGSGVPHSQGEALHCKLRERPVRRGGGRASNRKRINHGLQRRAACSSLRAPSHPSLGGGKQQDHPRPCLIGGERGGRGLTKPNKPAVLAHGGCDTGKSRLVGAAELRSAERRGAKLSVQGFGQEIKPPNLLALAHFQHLQPEQSVCFLGPTFHTGWAERCMEKRP